MVKLLRKLDVKKAWDLGTFIQDTSHTKITLRRHIFDIDIIVLSNLLLSNHKLLLL